MFSSVFLLLFYGSITSLKADASGQTSKRCILPPFPSNGSYEVLGQPSAAPGEAFDSVHLKVHCNPGVELTKNNDLFCVQGAWSDEMPKCIRTCRLNTHPSVSYRCSTPGSNEGRRDCEQNEPVGTVVEPFCKPGYYLPVDLRDMHCLDGSWDYVAFCVPDCGVSNPESLILDGPSSLRGKVPWQAGIYRKERNEGYNQICSGSLVTEKFVISAAHCFHKESTGVLPPSNYLITLGKIYRDLNDSRDTVAQISDVEDIKVPPRFTGSTTNYQADIALVKLVSPIKYNRFTRPICLDFNINFERQQLQDGNLGMFAGWGISPVTGVSSQILNIRNLPYVDITRCIAETPINSRELITSDKMCAGRKATAGACRGDAGGGLAFPEVSRGVTRFYLRGVLSTAPASDDLCNTDNYVFFTEVSKYEQYIKSLLLEL